MDDSEIVYDKNGRLCALNGKDAVSLMTIQTIIMGINAHVQTNGRMRITRGATISFLLKSASKYTGKTYRVRKSEDHLQAVKDLKAYFDEMKAALPQRELTY